MDKMITKINEIFPDIEINDIIGNILDCLINTNDNMFITGPAGCGKSTLLNIIQNKEIFDKNSVVLCPTGISAVNVGGVTLNRFFGFPPTILSETDCMKSLRVYEDENEDNCYKLNLLKNVDVFIIDEISMVNANMFDSIDLYLRFHLNSDLPFAGKRIILFGDLYQFPPVVKHHSTEYVILKNFYGDNGFYFFNSWIYNKVNFHRFLLEKVYRQNDSEFIEILHRVRKGTQTVNDIKKINTHVIDEGDFMDKFDSYLYIAYNNDSVNIKNKEYLDIIPSEQKVYLAKTKGNINKKDFTAPEELQLKVGAQVLVCANTNTGLYNGMLGTITEMGDEYIYFKDKNGKIHAVTEYTWESYDYTLEGKDVKRESVGKYIQFPLKLAFALTAHKCQGLSLDAIYLDTGSGSFCTGQFYVALSRLRTFEGLGLKKAINMYEVKVDPVVSEFFEIMEN